MMGKKINYEPVFFKTQNGKEPVRDWIQKNFKKQQRDEINTDMLFVVKHFPNVPKQKRITTMSRNPHKGTNFYDYLKEEGMSKEVHTLMKKSMDALWRKRRKINPGF